MGCSVQSAAPHAHACTDIPMPGDPHDWASTGREWTGSLHGGLPLDGLLAQRVLDGHWVEGAGLVHAWRSRCGTVLELWGRAVDGSDEDGQKAALFWHRVW